MTKQTPRSFDFANAPAAIQADCLEAMPLLPANSIDMILVDLPYCITQNKWDTPIPLEDYIDLSGEKISFSVLQKALWCPSGVLRRDPIFRGLADKPIREISAYWEEHKQPGLWSNFKRLIKPNGVIALFGAGMFSAELMRTGKDLWRYNIIWEKPRPTGFLNANRMPLRSHEDIMIFYRRLPVYHPQKTTGHVRKVSTAKHKRNSRKTTNYGDHGLTTYDSTERYPTSVWRFSSDTQKEALHPTQKPVCLCEELIKTYTDEGALVLDCCAGSFTTAIACDNLARSFFAIEQSASYYDIGLNRINENRSRLGIPPVSPIVLN